MSDTEASNGAGSKRARPQDREVRARRQLILAAREAFERDGFHGARIVDVAKAAGVGIGTFYRHFASKGILFRAVVAHAFDEIYVSGATRASEPSDPAAQIELANQRFLEQYRSEARLHSLLEQLAPVDEECRQLYLSGRARAVERIARSIASLQAQGLANPQLDPKVAAGVLVAMANNSAHIWFTLGEPYDEDVALATLNQIWIRGIGLTPAANGHAPASKPGKPGKPVKPVKPRSPGAKGDKAARKNPR